MVTVVVWAFLDTFCDGGSILNTPDAERWWNNSGDGKEIKKGERKEQRCDAKQWCSHTNLLIGDPQNEDQLTLSRED